MKHTEQRWMHPNNRHIAEVNDHITNAYIPVTVTWDEPEWEDVEVVRYLLKRKEDGKFADYATDGSDPYDPALYDVVKLTGTYRRRKPEPEPEAWEGVVFLNKLSTEAVAGGWVTDLPSSWIGKKVRMELI